MANWNAQQYKKFEYERTLPAKDLANAIPFRNSQRIIDIGCGIGNSTRVLKNKFYDSYVVGADNSENMLLSARNDHPDIEFMLFDANKDFDNLTERYDIVFSNACIQWLPDHKSLLTKMMNILNDGGILAIQIPLHTKHPMHRIITNVAGSIKWKNMFDSPRELNNLTAEEYFDILSSISTDFSMWETTYMHRMPSHNSIIEWYKGTGLRPYLTQLDMQNAAEFEKDILSETQRHYKVRNNGEIIFEFPRLFFTADKK